MKRIVTLLLTLALTVSFAALPASAQEGTGLKLGLYIHADAASSKDAADTDGLAQVDADAVAVLVDADGRIVNLAIDSAQTKMPFTATGALGANFPTEPKTKKEMGTEYGMAQVSKVGEWDQQIEAFRRYVIGKTAAEVQGIALDASTKPTDADLTAGCTMSVGTYVNAVVAAIAAATPVNASATDTVGLGIVTATDGSKDAMDGADGLCEAYSTYVAVTLNAAGEVTASRIDSTQGKITFDATGKITSDVTALFATKQEIGDGYGMKAASPIGKEWYEQANAFAAYLIGKTATAVDGIALDASTKPTDTDLTASVTISAGDFKAAALKAIANAQ